MIIKWDRKQRYKMIFCCIVLIAALSALAVSALYNKFSGNMLPENPVTDKSPEQMNDAEYIQYEILNMFQSERNLYGTEYGGKKLTAEGFAEALYTSFGAEVAFDDIQIGDCAFGTRGISGVCVGFYEEHPVFAYASLYAAYGPVASGICLGFAEADEAGLFLGMYPVDFTTFRRGCEGSVSNEAFEKVIKEIPPLPWYVALCYQYGSMMSSRDMEMLLASVDTKRLSYVNKRLDPELFGEFLETLPGRFGFEGSYYTTVKSAEETDNGISLTIGFVPKEEKGAFRCLGEWGLVFYENERKFLPCAPDIVNHAEIGLVRNENVKIIEDGSGTVEIQRETIIYGQTVDEEGRNIYRFSDGTVVYLDNVLKEP